MGRNKVDFQQSALYHGTIHPFEIGDVVTPSYGGGHDSEYAWATSDRESAENYARAAQDSKWSERMKQGERLDYPQHKEEHPQRVYEVQALGDEFATDPNRLQEGTVQSRKGFKVVKRVK